MAKTLRRAITGETVTDKIGISRDIYLDLLSLVSATPPVRFY